MKTRAKSRRAGRTLMPVLILATVVVAAAVVLATFGGIGFRGRGGGGGDLGPATRPAARAQAAPGRPLVITVDGHEYAVDGKPATLGDIAGLAAKIPPGDGPDVRVERLDSSRVTAETSLAEKLRQLGKTVVWSPPL